MSKKNEFTKNTIILMAGKISTQFISFLLIPIYTRFYETADYGTVDLFQGYISLLVPLLILRFDSAVFRFLIDERGKEDNKRTKSIVTNALLTLLMVAFGFVVVYIVINAFISIKYSTLVCLSIISIMSSNILLQIARGLGSNIDYSIGCLLCGVTILFTNIILIFSFSANAGGILIASALGNCICSLYLLFKLDIKKYFDIDSYNKVVLKEMLAYSLPMMPNTISWWLVNISDRTLIAVIWGTALNGIYTISCKFSNILNSVFNIFNMSWQESASIHIDDEDKEVYFTKMITSLLALFMYLILGLMTVLPVCFKIIVGDRYADSYIYIPILLIANIFHILIQLIGGIYIAKKQTKKIMNTTLTSAVINLVINLLFIKRFALFAASISTFVAYTSMAIYRYIDSKKLLKYSIDIREIVPLTILLLVATVLFYVRNSMISVAFLALVLCFGFAKYKQAILRMLNKILRRT